IGLNSTSGANVNASPQQTTTYTVVISLNSCTNSAVGTVQITTCTRILEQSRSINNIVVYPNPSTGDLYFSSSVDRPVSVYNELGQLVTYLVMKAGKESKVSNLPAGIYTIVSDKSRSKVIITK